MSHSRQSCYIPLAPTPLSRYSKKLLFFLSSFFSWFPQVTSPVAYCKGEIYPASRKRTAYGVRAGLFLVDKTSSTSDWISNQINNPPRQKADLCKRKAMSLDRFSVPIATKNQKKKREAAVIPSFQGISYFLQKTLVFFWLLTLIDNETIF